MISLGYVGSFDKALSLTRKIHDLDPSDHSFFPMGVRMKVHG